MAANIQLLSTKGLRTREPRQHACGRIRPRAPLLWAEVVRSALPEPKNQGQQGYLLRAPAGTMAVNQNLGLGPALAS